MKFNKLIILILINEEKQNIVIYLKINNHNIIFKSM